MIKQVIDCKLRGTDEAGSGEFGASRDGGKRTHKGLDIACVPHLPVIGGVAGRISKLGYPYGDDLTWRYVEITNKNLRHRFFYVEPADWIKVDKWVRDRDIIGMAQDISDRYSASTPHIHYEVMDEDDNYIDPNEYLS